MIFVTTGISGAPFDRLLSVVDDLPTDEEIVVQHGPSPLRPKRARCVPFLPFNELSDLVRRASIVITHAGAGSVLVALANGKYPIVIPRLPQYGELVDDHQLRFARHLADAGLASVVEEPGALASFLATARMSSSVAPPVDSRLVSDLAQYLQSVCDSRLKRALVTREASNA